MFLPQPPLMLGKGGLQGPKFHPTPRKVNFGPEIFTPIFTPPLVTTLGISPQMANLAPPSSHPGVANLGPGNFGPVNFTPYMGRGSRVGNSLGRGCATLF